MRPRRRKKKPKDRARAREPAAEQADDLQRLVASVKRKGKAKRA